MIESCFYYFSIKILGKNVSFLSEFYKQYYSYIELLNLIQAILFHYFLPFLRLLQVSILSDIGIFLDDELANVFFIEVLSIKRIL